MCDVQSGHPHRRSGCVCRRRFGRTDTDGQIGASRGGGDQLDDELMDQQQRAARVPSDEGGQAMFYEVPYTGAHRQAHDRAASRSGRLASLTRSTAHPSLSHRSAHCYIRTERSGRSAFVRFAIVRFPLFEVWAFCRCC
jgi:hypothetical protein